MKINNCFQLGYIIKPHGIHGAFTVLIDSDNPEYYRELESVYVEIQQELTPFFIDSIQISGNRADLKLKNIHSIEQASPLKGCALFLPLHMLPELEDHQFYYHEVVGFSVKDHIHGELGKIKTVYEANGNDLFAVDHKGTEILIPIRDEFIIDMNKKKRSILVHLPDGLLEIYLKP